MTTEETLVAIAKDIREIKSRIDYLKRYEKLRVEADVLLNELEYWRNKEKNKGL